MRIEDFRREAGASKRNIAGSVKTLFVLLNHAEGEQYYRTQSRAFQHLASILLEAGSTLNLRFAQ